MKAKERHDIKTDTFLELVGRAEEFILDHARVIGISLLVIIIAVVATISITSYIDSTENTASFAVNKLLPKFNEIQKMEAPEAEAIDQLSAEFVSVTKEHSGSAASVISKYYLGLLSLKIADEESAVKYFQEVFKSKQKVYWSLAAKQLADIQTINGKHIKAAELFAEVADSNSLSVPKALFSFYAGRSYEKAGDNNNALLYYNKAKESEELALDNALTAKIEKRIQNISEVKE